MPPLRKPGARRDQHGLSAPHPEAGQPPGRLAAWGPPASLPGHWQHPCATHQKCAGSQAEITTFGFKKKEKACVRSDQAGTVCCLQSHLKPN